MKFWFYRAARAALRPWALHSNFALYYYLIVAREYLNLIGARLEIQRDRSTRLGIGTQPVVEEQEK